MKMAGIVLAGGRTGSMGSLTEKRADAALPVAGGFRAVDFTLTSMVSSGISNVSVLVQAASGSLNDHLNQPQWWGFGRKRSGLFVVNPTITAGNIDWHKGTADSIWKSLRAIKKYHEPYIAIASGDCVYKLDFEKVLEAHIENEADVTIVCTKPNPLMDIRRFGVIETDETGRIISFHEKPEEKTPGMISCGIYIMRKRFLISRLEEAIPAGKYNFVRDILIPAVDDHRVFAYEYKGYWRNIAQKDDYYNCNMDFLKPEVRRMLYEEPRILTKEKDEAPARFYEGSVVKNSIVFNGSKISGEVTNSVIFENVRVGKFSKIINSLLLPGVKVGDNCLIENSIVNSRTVIEPNNILSGYGRE